MAFFKCRVGDKTYELDKLTLGDSRLLKREFGLVDLEEFNTTDPDQLVGLLVICLKRERPSADLGALIAEVEAMDIEEFESVADEDAEGPTEDAKPVKAGASATRRKTSGSPRS